MMKDPKFYDTALTNITQARITCYMEHKLC